MTILYIALGGIAGTLSRYGLEGWIQSRTATGFPLGTITVNVTGSLLLGFIIRVATGTALISARHSRGLDHRVLRRVHDHEYVQLRERRTPQ